MKTLGPRDPERKKELDAVAVVFHSQGPGVRSQYFPSRIDRVIITTDIAASIDRTRKAHREFHALFLSSTVLKE